ncbi:hypothetical protein [Paenibacillus chibensis]|uniref:hypothetical protein n=1 Tax=Paenibacillus chibensis TaxID=59846 RepID=UPI0013E2BA9F|nr:hypothetical protein [Paenibacillus chibensis]MEC0372427.1 hypothetical protein [Paenibacillus chibensis]
MRAYTDEEKPEPWVVAYSSAFESMQRDSKKTVMNSESKGIGMPRHSSCTNSLVAM